ncbi:MAG: hypothetical protein EPO65_12770 [Dehalococcoidia bacterium]|nr:MAG: hypothetical protein EPO65_12770 [Dehalococcoidia bacterium]
MRRETLVGLASRSLLVPALAFALTLGAALGVLPSDHPRVAHAASIASAQDGNWDAPTTWTGGVVPGAEDTVTVGAGHTVTVVAGTSAAAASLAVAGAVVNNGILTVSGAISGAGSVSQYVGATLSAGGDVTVTTLSAVTNPNTVNYTGAAQTVKGTTYHHLGISGSATKTLAGATSTNGYLRVAAGAAATTAGGVAIGTELCLAAAAQFTVAAGHTVTVGGNVEVGSATCGTAGADAVLTNNGIVTVSGAVSGGGTLVNAANATLNLGGSGTIATLTATASPNTVNYAGAGQTVKGTTYHHLTFSGTSAAMFGDVTVNGTLGLTNGTVQTGASALILPASGSVNRTTGHVIGNLRKDVATGATARTFEVGMQGFAPVTVVFGNVTVAGSLTVSTTAGDHPSTGWSGLSSTQSVNRYWTLTNGGISFDTYGVTFTFPAGNLDGGTSTDALLVGRYDGGAWTLPTVGTRTATTTQVTGLTAFGDFQIAQVAVAVAPPPVVVPPTPTPVPVPLPVPAPADLPTVALGAPSIAATSTLLPATVVATSSTGAYATVSVPAGALLIGSTVQVAAIVSQAALTTAAPPPTGLSIVAGFQINARTNLGVALTGNFFKPVVVEFFLPTASVPAGTVAQDLVLAFWNGTTWTAVPATVVINGNGSAVVTASLTHFTVFSVQSRPPTPATPATGTFSPAPVAGVTITSWSGGDLTGLLTALTGSKSAWVFVGGRTIGYVINAPAFVNADFVALYPTGAPAGTFMVVVR